MICIERAPCSFIVLSEWRLCCCTIRRSGKKEGSNIGFFWGTSSIELSCGVSSIRGDILSLNASLMLEELLLAS